MANQLVDALVKHIKQVRPDDSALATLLVKENVVTWSLSDICDLLRAVGYAWPVKAERSRELMAQAICRYGFQRPSAGQIVIRRFEPNQREIIALTSEGAYWISDETRQSSRGSVG